MFIGRLSVQESFLAFLHPNPCWALRLTAVWPGDLGRVAEEGPNSLPGWGLVARPGRVGRAPQRIVGRGCRAGPDGAGEGIRTPDLLFTRQLLCQAELPQRNRECPAPE